MQHLPPMVDMALTPKEIEEEKADTPWESPMPKYPYGLSICFTQDELDKLELDPADVDVGDVVHLFAFAKVTSKSVNETDEGQKARIEMQIIAISSEDENTENEAMDEASSINRMYGM